MEENNGNQEKSVSLYSRFYNSRAFYPIMLTIIAGLCVSVWAVSRSRNKPVENTTTTAYEQAARVVTDVADERTESVKLTSEPTTKKITTTYAYEANKPYEGDYLMPVAKGKISKDYSNGALVESKTMGDFRVHNGSDFSGKEGESVIAINSGIVEDVYTDAFWGVVLVINHGGGMKAKYCGLTSGSTAAKNTVVAKGDIIGKIGTIPCEKKDGTHIHLEITVDKETVDPLIAMNKINSNE